MSDFIAVLLRIAFKTYSCFVSFSKGRMGRELCSHCRVNGKGNGNTGFIASLYPTKRAKHLHLKFPSHLSWGLILSFGPNILIGTDLIGWFEADVDWFFQFLLNVTSLEAFWPEQKTGHCSEMRIKRPSTCSGTHAIWIGLFPNSRMSSMRKQIIFPRNQLQKQIRIRHHWCSIFDGSEHVAFVEDLYV